MLFLLICMLAYVAGAPTITLKPDITTGKSLILECPTKTKEDFVFWYKYDKNTKEDVELQFGARIDFPDLNSVELKSPSLKDAGVYNCKNPIDGSVLKIFKVKPFDSRNVKPTDKVVSVDAPRWILLPNPLKIADSDKPSIIPCRADGKNVKTTAYRLKDSGEILYKLPQSGVVLHRPKAEDSGKYLCIAENEGGTLRHTFEVLVRVNGGLSDWEEWGPCDAPCGYGVKSRHRTCTNPRPANGGRRCSDTLTDRQRCRERSCSTPRLTKFGFEITDKELIVHCHAKGIPSPTVLWKRDGRVFDSTYDYKNPTMKIPIARARGGSYSCRIRNQAGYFTMYISIDL